MSRSKRRHAPTGLTVALLLACGLMLALAWRPAPAWAEPSDAEISAAVEAILASDWYQTELPGAPEAEEAEADPEPSNWRFDLPDGILGLARVLMWLLVGAGALLLVIFVINEVSSFGMRRRSRAARPEAPSTPAEAAAAGNGSGLSLDEADRLAREGRYAEALHMLLLDCFAQLRRLRFDAVIAPSLTSRELARRLTLPEPSARALAAIVSAVELSHFGGRLPGEDEYRRCRQDYLQIASDSAEAAQ